MDILRHIRCHEEQENENKNKNKNKNNAKRDDISSSASSISQSECFADGETKQKILRGSSPMDDSNTPALVKVLTRRVFEMIFEEVNTTESQMLIKRKIITPVINMIYVELYPYIIAMIVSILTILILSSLTFIGFIVYFIKK